MKDIKEPYTRNAIVQQDIFTKKENALIFTPTSTPIVPEEGMVYYDSSMNKLRCCNGTIWNDLF